MRKILPPLPLLHLPNLVDSEIWAAAVTRAADESHLKREPGPVAEREVPLTFVQSARRTSATWADAQGGNAGNYIDNEVFKSKPFPLPLLSPYPLAQIHPTAPDPVKWGELKQSADTTPTRIVVEGYSFWQKRPRGIGVQEWVFQKADVQKT